MHPNYVVIHCKPSLKDYLNENNINWTYSKDFGYDELDVIVNDVPYEIMDGTYQDPDEQLCEHYGIDYNQINCIESMY